MTCFQFRRWLKKQSSTFESCEAAVQEKGFKKAELARLMKLHRQEIERLLDFKQSTSIGKIERAFAALGKQLKIEVADAP